MLVVINLQTLSFISIPTVQARQSEAVGFCARVELAANDGIANLKKGRRQHKIMDFGTQNKKDGLIDARLEYDKKRDSHFAELIKKYGSSQNKEAISLYRQKLSVAIELRRTSIDTIRAEFRSRIGEVSIQHRNQIDAAESQLISDVDAAFSKAKQDCQSGADQQTTKDNFINDMKTAKSTFLQAKSAVLSESSIDSLVNERDVKIKAAFEAFKTTMQAARTELISALNKN